MSTQAHDWCDRYRRILDMEAEIAADKRELELEGKAIGLNVSAMKKWLKAERSDKVEKLTADVVDLVAYGESLGHDLGILQNNSISPNVTVRNNSKESSADSVPPHDSARKGDEGGAYPSSSPIHSPVSLTAAGPEGEGDGSPEPRTPEPTEMISTQSARSGVLHVEDDLALPAFLDRRGHG